MTDKFIIVDANAIINLFAGAGERGWDQLLNVGGGKKIIVLDEALEELQRLVNGNAIKETNLPFTLKESLTAWVELHKQA
jgi:hypothetical protein